MQKNSTMLTNSTLLALSLFTMMPSSLAMSPLSISSIELVQADESSMAAPFPSDEAADEPAASGSVSEGPADAMNVPTVSPTANYSDAQMSIDYPVAWQIAVSQEGNVQILDGVEGSADEVVTEVFVVDSPPGVLINANIDSFIAEGAAVGPYGQVTIDDQQALTIWLSDRPQDLSQAIATFIGYDDQTVLIFSRYKPENEAVEERLLDLHTSFQKVEPEPDSLLEENSPESESL